MTTIIVSGPVANKPANGGIVWNEISYVVGLQRLGFDVHFWEQISPDACRNASGNVCPFSESSNLEYFKHVTNTFGIAARSALIYNGGTRVYGSTMTDLAAVADEAALLINISGHLQNEALRSRIRSAVYIDEDPGYTQFWFASGGAGSLLSGHDAFYTVGTNIGAPDCEIPACGIDWRPLMQPIVLDMWPVKAGEGFSKFTTVASWRGAFGPVEYGGNRYGTKAHEFRKYEAMPSRSGLPFEVALDIHPADRSDQDRLLQHGWGIRKPGCTVADPYRFRNYIQGSGAEFSVVQGIYRETNSGWFSDRSVRYLASGKPVLLQDCGYGRNLPTGEGLLAFRTMDEAVKGARTIVANYEAHSEAARAIAESHFDSDRVLGKLMEEVAVAP